LPIRATDHGNAAEDSGQHESWASDAAKTGTGNKEFEVPEPAPNWAAM